MVQHPKTYVLFSQNVLIDIHVLIVGKNDDHDELKILSTKETVIVMGVCVCVCVDEVFFCER